MGSDRLYFRTRGGPTQGWGNIFRLASFAKHCQEKGQGSPLFLAEGPPEVIQYLEKRGFPTAALKEDLPLEEEEAQLRRYGHADVIFVEMLDVTPERQDLLNRYCDQLVIFDDLCDHIYDADLVVCGQALPSHANRDLSSARTRFLVGPEYFLCRPEFVPFSNRKRSFAKHPTRYLITLGGGAYDVGYLKIALALQKLRQESLKSQQPPIQPTFVLGYGQTTLRQRLLELLPEATVLHGVDDLEKHLWANDIAVISAGYTKFEAALTQTPFVMMSAQWHQIPLAQSFAAISGATDLGYMAYVDSEQIAHSLRALKDQGQRENQAKRARKAVDGRGFERVYQAAFESTCASVR